jgi:hypothetical protein
MPDSSKAKAQTPSRKPISYLGVRYPSIAALYKAWAGDKPSEKSFGARLLKLRKKYGDEALNDETIRQLFLTRSSRNKIVFEGKVYKGPKDLYLAYDREKIGYGTFWFRLNEYRKKNPNKTPSDSDLHALLATEAIHYKGCDYPSIAKLYEGINDQKITLTRFTDNLRNWRNQNPDKDLTEQVIDKCVRFYGGEHFRQFKGQTYENLKALFDAQPMPKCIWVTFQNRVRKLEALRTLVDEDYELLLKPQAKVDFFRGILYRWTHLKTNKVYIGISSQALKERIRMHHRQALDQKYSNPQSLQAAIAKDGLDAFKIEVLAEFEDVESMKAAEKQAIIDHDSLAPNGFNLQEGGISWTKQGQDVEYGGVVYPSYSALAKAFGITEKLLDGRRRWGWSLSDALNTPLNSKNSHSKAVTFRGVYYPSLKDLANSYDINPRDLYQKLDLGWELDEALGLSARQPKTRKAVVIAGKTFDTISSAARFYGKSPRETYARLQRGLTLEEALNIK